MDKPSSEIELGTFGNEIARAARFSRAAQIMIPMFGPSYFADLDRHVDFGSSCVIWDTHHGTAHALYAQSNN